MKNSPLTTFLLAVLAISAVLSVVFCWRYVSNTREMRALQLQVNNINARNARASALASEVIEYSRHNSAVDPILEAAGLKPKAASATSTNKPPAK